jgi:hypothetical protein
MIVIGEDGPCAQGPAELGGGVDEHGGDEVETVVGVEEEMPWVIGYPIGVFGY